MFQVVACPRCRRAKVVDAARKTTQCGSCGRPLELAHLRPFAASADPEEARHAAGILNARLAGREGEYAAALVAAPRASRHDDAFDAAAASSRRASSEKDRADRVARALSQSLGEFGEPDLARALHLAGIGGNRAEAHLKRMLETTVLYEPRPGRYRAF
ncbi:MAG TPA: hypothetical protein VNX21_01345 [Candidatus Thermoplasmatota archaeon]|nr:hypothetical protein [Candidatus Thermoplasmatota archaeon]